MGPRANSHVAKFVHLHQKKSQSSISNFKELHEVTTLFKILYHCVEASFVVITFAISEIYTSLYCR